MSEYYSESISMEQKAFEVFIKTLCEQDSLPLALDMLQSSEDLEIAEAARSLVGQFSAAEVDGKKRIYHISLHENDEGEQQEFVEHIMDEGDDLILFVAWFFEVMFEIKGKDIYQTAGKTYKQPKRS